MKKILYTSALLLPVALCQANEIVTQDDAIKNRRLMCAYALQMRTHHQDVEEQYLFPALDLAAALETSLDAAHLHDSLVKRVAYQAWRSRHMNGTLALPSYLQALTVLSDEMIHDLVIANIKGKTERILTEKAITVQQRETIITNLWSQLLIIR